MEPTVVAGVADQRTDRPRKARWLPGVLLAVVVLLALLAMGSAVSAQEGPEGVLATPWAVEFCKTTGMQCMLGDFNGDGKDDILQFNHAISPAGAVYVALSTGSTFGASQGWNSSSFCEQPDDICKAGDFNRDGKDDIVRFRRSTGDVSVAISKTPGPGFENGVSWLTNFCKNGPYGGETCDVGDYNGDGFDDVARFTRTAYVNNPNDPEWGKVYVALSNGSSFNPLANSWIKRFCGYFSGTFPLFDVCGTGDFDADGKDDVVAFNKDAGTVWVAKSTGSSFGSATVWRNSFCSDGEVCGVGDFNADGRDDVVTYLRSVYAGNTDPATRKIGYVYVARSNGSAFPSSTLWNNFFCIDGEICGTGKKIDTLSEVSYSQVSRSGDYDGDGRADLLTFLRSTDASKPGHVYVYLTPPPPDRWVVSLFLKLVPPP